MRSPQRKWNVQRRSSTSDIYSHSMLPIRPQKAPPNIDVSTSKLHKKKSKHTQKHRRRYWAWGKRLVAVFIVLLLLYTVFLVASYRSSRLSHREQAKKLQEQRKSRRETISRNDTRESWWKQVVDEDEQAKALRQQKLREIEEEQHRAHMEKSDDQRALFYMDGSPVTEKDFVSDDSFCFSYRSGAKFSCLPQLIIAGFPKCGEHIVADVLEGLWPKTWAPLNCSEGERTCNFFTEENFHYVRERAHVKGEAERISVAMKDGPKMRWDHYLSATTTRVEKLVGFPKLWDKSDRLMTPEHAEFMHSVYPPGRKPKVLILVRDIIDLTYSFWYYLIQGCKHSTSNTAECAEYNLPNFHKWVLELMGEHSQWREDLERTAKDGDKFIPVKDFQTILNYFEDQFDAANVVMIDLYQYDFATLRNKLERLLAMPADDPNFTMNLKVMQRVTMMDKTEKMLKGYYRKFQSPTLS